jgi:hypothetical protein
MLGSVCSKPTELAKTGAAAKAEAQAAKVLKKCRWNEHLATDERACLDIKAFGLSIWKVSAEPVAAQE